MQETEDHRLPLAVRDMLHFESDCVRAPPHATYPTLSPEDAGARSAHYITNARWIHESAFMNNSDEQQHRFESDVMLALRCRHFYGVISETIGIMIDAAMFDGPRPFFIPQGHFIVYMSRAAALCFVVLLSSPDGLCWVQAITWQHVLSATAQYKPWTRVQSGAYAAEARIHRQRQRAIIALLGVRKRLASTRLYGIPKALWRDSVARVVWDSYEWLPVM